MSTFFAQLPTRAGPGEVDPYEQLAARPVGGGKAPPAKPSWTSRRSCRARFHIHPEAQP